MCCRKLGANYGLYYQYYYDEIIIPAELAGVHYKVIITMRNRWLVDQSDCLIAYIYRDFGGVLETVKYAQKQGEPVINPVEQNKITHLLLLSNTGMIKEKQE